MLNFTARQIRKEQERINKTNRITEEQWERIFQDMNRLIQHSIKTRPQDKFCIFEHLRDNKSESVYIPVNSLTEEERIYLQEYFEDLGYTVIFGSTYIFDRRRTDFHTDYIDKVYISWEEA